MEAYELLEKELAEWSGMPHVVACSSGTAALHLALESLQLPAGSRVIVPDFTMVACPRAVTLAGLEPVFVDCNERLLMDDGEPFGNATVDPYSVFMAVHIYGRRMDMDWIASTAGVCHPVIEDLAEAHGIRPHEETAVACWSFYRNKIIAGEEGGAVGFRDPKLAVRARQLRSLGFTDNHDFVHVPRGCNYRLSNANANLILRNFRAEKWVRDNDVDSPLWVWHYNRRREAEFWYDELCPAKYRMPPRDAPWVYDFRVPGMSPIRQTELVRALQAEGIAARHTFKPCHTQEEYRRCPVYGNGNAAVASREVVYIPLTPGQVTRESARKAFEVIGKIAR